jgi:hypothetical protein
MKLLLKRIALKETYTIGHLYVDNVKFCDTLEDKVRPDGVKVYGETAIPEGKYRVILTWSNRFKRRLPLLLNVPMFEGIRIHPGNTAVDTHGCILVGVNDVKGRISQSKFTFYELFKRMTDSKLQEFELEITNP